jgi:WhiB family transcriptional regulator, redox-sensing transcriptional regulator
MSHHAWMDKAACLGQDPDDWFPDHTSDYTITIDALRVCTTLCPVKAECLEMALTEGFEHGIYGGMRPEQRKQLKNQRKREKRKHTMASRMRNSA